MVLWVALNILVSVAGVFASMEIYKWKHKKEKGDDIAAEHTKSKGDEKVQKFLSENDFSEVSDTSKPNNSSPEVLRKRH